LLPLVNAILGLPFITQTKMIIDTSDQVAEMRAFDTPPFPTNFHCAMCAVPVIDNASAATNAALHSNILREIESIKEHIKKRSTALLTQEKSSGNLPVSILLQPKQSQVIDFSNSTSKSNTNIASIGLAIDPFHKQWRQMPTRSAFLTPLTQHECELALSQILLSSPFGAIYRPRAIMCYGLLP
jgi:hypothetical protein